MLISHIIFLDLKDLRNSAPLQTQTYRKIDNLIGTNLSSNIDKKWSTIVKFRPNTGQILFEFSYWYFQSRSSRRIAYPSFHNKYSGRIPGILRRVMWRSRRIIWKGHFPKTLLKNRPKIWDLQFLLALAEFAPWVPLNEVRCRRVRSGGLVPGRRGRPQGRPLPADRVRSQS